ncbi:prephenate dehydrogenase/arogenate dehydrogenase family protein [Luteolibacter sp. LG18]|uniref:prephenate dehydrogenase n=1 Tax=Luteolibacter sp. LG18 TaxID=2819286 RepID=UPI0030C6E0C5
MDFQKVAVLGGGLLGGSLALALTKKFPDLGVSLWARREETAATARSLGIAGATSELPAAVAGADLVVLAVPVGAMPDLVKKALAAGLAAGAVVTDVGSVKGVVHATLPPVLAGSGIPFIGSHPMAGSEHGGIEAAKATLFESAACLLTDDQRSPVELRGKLERFWQSVGCRTSWMLSAVHDELVARISHLPHVIAAAGATVALRDPGDGRFGGGGLRDTTRVAGGDPAMWTEILMENREALAAPLRETIAGLREMLASLEAGDHETVHRLLATAKTRRDALPLNR